MTMEKLIRDNTLRPAKSLVNSAKTLQSSDRELTVTYVFLDDGMIIPEK